MDTPKIPTVDADKLALMGRSCVSFHVRRAARSVDQHYARALAPLGVRPGQLSVLGALLDGAPRAMNDLVDVFALEQSTLSRNLATLAKRGWVRFTRGADRRTKLVSLTAAGRDVVHRAYPLWEVAHREIVEALGGDATTDATLSTLRRLTRAAV